MLRDGSTQWMDFHSVAHVRCRLQGWRTVVGFVEQNVSLRLMHFHAAGSSLKVHATGPIKVHSGSRAQHPGGGELLAESAATCDVAWLVKGCRRVAGKCGAKKAAKKISRRVKGRKK
jgi:hypothetical protein